MHASYDYKPLANVDQQVNKESGQTISSPILFDLLNNLAEEEHHEILDILPASQGMIDLFSGLSCKLYLPGCLYDLSAVTSERYDTENKLKRAFTKLFRLNKKNQADLKMVFLWDLPNYLDGTVMKVLIEYLSQHMHEKVKLHFYIHTRQSMPASPGTYFILDGVKVRHENSVATTIKSPLYFQKSLQSLLYPFKVKRSMLLSGGLQEYIMEL